MEEQKVVSLTRVDVLKQMMSADSVQEQFKNALGANSNSFVASIIDLYGGDTQLQSCTPKSVVMEALKAAVMKLPINKALGFAYIIVFNNSVKNQATGVWEKHPTPTFVLGYKGYIQLAMRTGQYKYINADVVYEGELQRVNKLSGEINLEGKKTSDKVIGYFAYIELMNGFSKTIYVELENMAKHAKRYSPGLRAKKEVTVQTLMALGNIEQNTGAVGWLGDFESMALKTCLRNVISKYGYLSIEMIDAISKDNEDAEDTRDGAVADVKPTLLDIEDADFSEIKDGAAGTAPSTTTPPTGEAEIPY